MIDIIKLGEQLEQLPKYRFASHLRLDQSSVSLSIMMCEDSALELCTRFSLVFHKKYADLLTQVDPELLVLACSFAKAATDLRRESRLFSRPGVASVVLSRMGAAVGLVYLRARVSALQTYEKSLALNN
jgi:hypothetical protein